MSKSYFLRSLFIVTIANFVAQIPYYLQQYYLPSHTSPSPAGLLLMAVVLIWFIVGYFGLVARRKSGYFLTLGFLLAEFLFYLQTQIIQFVTGHGILLYILHPHGWILFIVFGIGYINFFAAGWFMLHLLTQRSEYLDVNA